MQGKSTHHPTSSLSQIFLCKLCYSKAVKPLLCPQCAKFYCENCIKQYLRQKDSKCPHCSKFLQISQLINGQKICEELGTAFNKIDSTIKHKNQFQTCQQHNLPKTYYCNTCQVALCSDCSVLSSEHRTHQLVKLSQIQERFITKNNQLLTRLNEKKAKILQLKESLLQSQTKSVQSKESKILVLQHRIRVVKHFKTQLSEKLNLKLNSHIENCEKSRKSQIQLLERYQETHKRLLKTLSDSGKARLVSQEGIELKKQLIDSINENKKLSTPETDWRTSDFDTKSELIPKPYHKKFILDNYTCMREKKGYVYSETLFGDGLEWRLKIYPNGVETYERQVNQQISIESSSKSKEDCLAIYVELKKGLQAIGQYSFRIEITNHKDSAKNLTKRHVSKFKSGQCWGYDSFAPINRLYTEGFIHPKEDYLEIMLQVGSPTYYHAVLDQQKTIQQKSEKHREMSQRFLELHERINKGRLLLRANSSRQSLVVNRIDTERKTTSNKLLTPRGSQETSYINKIGIKPFRSFVAGEEGSKECQSQTEDAKIDIQLPKIYRKTQDISASLL